MRLSVVTVRLALPVLVLHAAGIALTVVYAADAPVLVGLGWTAYLFGLRHAFDVDHIAAIDNTTRRLVQDGQRPLATGLWFSLGHSTVVLVFTIAIALAARTADGSVQAMSVYGGAVSAAVSAAFLCAIGLANLVVLIGILRVARGLREGTVDPAGATARTLSAGVMTRLLGRFLTPVSRSWQLYPVGLLFGLGFDTASEVGLLALAAAAATNAPAGAVLALPLLFAAGMSLVDTADGAFMCHAYGWAVENPVRRLFYNALLTGISVLVALTVGGAELLQIAGVHLELASMGYVVVALFVLVWAASWCLWRTCRIEDGWTEQVAPPA